MQPPRIPDEMPDIEDEDDSEGIWTETQRGFAIAWGQVLRGETHDIATLWDDWDCDTGHDTP